MDIGDAHAVIHLNTLYSHDIADAPPQHLVVPADTRFQYVAGRGVTRAVPITEFADFGGNLPEWLSVVDVSGTQHIFRSGDIIAVTIN